MIWSLSKSLPYHCSRKAAPDGRQPRLVEGEDDHRQDRDVEEGEAEAEAGDEEDGPPGSWLALRHSAPWPRSGCRPSSAAPAGSSSATATADAMGQSRAEVNSSAITRPIIGLAALPTRLGMISSPVAGMKTSRPPAMMPGMRQRQGHVPEHLPGPRAQIHRGLVQGRVELLEIGVERQDHEGQVGIDHDEHDREIRVHHRDRLERPFAGNTRSCRCRSAPC